MKTNQLYAKVDGKWQRVCEIRATGHAEALRQAIGRLTPEHYDKPIKLEQRESPPPRG